MALLYYWRPDNYQRDLDFGAGFHLNQGNPVHQWTLRGDITFSLQIILALWIPVGKIADADSQGRPRAALGLMGREVCIRAEPIGGLAKCRLRDSGCEMHTPKPRGIHCGSPICGDGLRPVTKPTGKC